MFYCYFTDTESKATLKNMGKYPYGSAKSGDITPTKQSKTKPCMGCNVSQCHDDIMKWKHFLHCRLFFRGIHVVVISGALLALCEGNPPVTGEFPSQRASNADWLIDLYFPWFGQGAQSYEHTTWNKTMKNNVKWIGVTKITQWRRNRTKGLFVFTGGVFKRVQWV